MQQAISEHKIKIAQQVRALLLSNSEIVSLVESKIVPLVASDEVVGDFITYKRYGYTQEIESKMGLTSEKCQVLLEIVSDDYDRSIDIGYVVVSYLVGEWSDPKMKITLEESDEDYKDKKFYQIFLFNVE